MSKQLPADMKLTAGQAREKVIPLIRKWGAAFRDGQYSPLENGLAQLIPLLKRRLGGATSKDRIDNPGHLTDELIILMSDSRFKNMNNDNLRYQLASALHVALDLVVVESYEEKWVDFSKSIGSIDIMSTIQSFDRGDPSWGLRYELKCCEANVKVLEKKKSTGEHIFETLKLAADKNILGLLGKVRELIKEFGESWQIPVLLMRRITPWAQRSLKELIALQSVMAEECKGFNFYCCYAAQEALHEVLIENYGTDAEREAIQRQAIGDLFKFPNPPRTLYDWAQVRLPVPGQSNREDRCRYRLIQTVEHLLSSQLSLKQPSPILLSTAVELFANLRDSYLLDKEQKHKHLEKSREWIKKLQAQSVIQAQPDLQKKQLACGFQGVRDEKRSVSAKRENQKSLKKAFGEKEQELKKTQEQLLAQEAQTRALISENAALGARDKHRQGLEAKIAQNEAEIESLRKKYTMQTEELRLTKETLQRQIFELAEQEERLHQQTAYLQEREAIMALHIEEQKSDKQPATVTTAAEGGEELKLQDDLITACEQGDEARVQALLEQGAKPNGPGTGDWILPGKQPLGAAVWGMNPEVVNLLLWQMNIASPMTWAQCERHNKIHYQVTFIMPSFLPQNFTHWHALLKTLDSNPFLRAHHLKECNEIWHNTRSSSWENLIRYVGRIENRIKSSMLLSLQNSFSLDSSILGDPIWRRILPGFAKTEEKFAIYRKLIKLKVEISAMIPPIVPPAIPAEIPRVSQNSRSFLPAPRARLSVTGPDELQDELVIACGQGDCKAALVLLERGAKPDRPNTAGNYPLNAAIWGMNPEMVKELLQRMDGVSPITWEKCLAHNLTQYGAVFLISEFAPQTYGAWCQLLEKMESNPRLQEYHLKKCQERWRDHADSSSWESLKRFIMSRPPTESSHYYGLEPVADTEREFSNFRRQIQEAIETAVRPTAAKAFQS